MIQFQEDKHLYQSIVPDDIRWVGCTTLVSSMKSPFLRQQQAEKSNKNRNSKWYMIPVEDILSAWDNEAKRASDLGHWYHDKREKEMWSRGEIDGLKVIRPVMQDGIKLAPIQTLVDGIYPEHLIYLRSAGICGQADVVRVQDNTVQISDYKTSKEITTEGYTNWEGIRKKMLVPLTHLEDCHLTHYALQMSIYMYMIIRWNPSFKIGTMYIDHIKFVETGKDRYGYPLHYREENGDPVVESITKIEVPYLKSEVITIIEYLKNPEHRSKIMK